MLIFSTILLESSFFPHQILILSNFINISMNIFSFCEATRKNNLKNESPAAENCELEMFLSMNQIDFTHFLIRISNFVFQQLLLSFVFTNVVISLGNFNHYSGVLRKSIRAQEKVDVQTSEKTKLLNRNF